MKKLSLLLGALSIAFFANSQTLINDSVSMNTGYQDDVFYSLSTGIKNNVTIKNWDLAFCINSMDVGIRVNAVNGINLYAVPGIDINGWATMDSAGYQGWQELHNTDTAMFTGAFNINPNGGGFDFSWGVYDIGTHEVVGDSLFLIKVTDLQSNVYFKKLWIIKRADNTTHDWVFRYANLDNTADTTVTIPTTTYNTKNFIYYSIINSNTIDREPANTDWDILFTRYTTDVGGGVYYPIAGVYSNYGVEVADVRSVDVSSTNSDAPYLGLYNINLTEIGYDWKSFNLGTNMYDIEDSLVYFVKTNAGDIYKLVMTGFDGSLTGNIYFNKTFLYTTVVNEINSSVLQSVLYPNPVNDFATVLFVSEKSGNLDYNIYDINGKLVKSARLEGQTGLNKITIPTSGLSKGVYTLELKSGDKKGINKLVKL